MTLNAIISDGLIEELTEIMNAEKDDNRAPKSTKRNGKKATKEER